ncbi:hypothetical protein RAS1_00880 [Phycisphaerae bacterium RAS1]|nr:hypothetical protein RAS1_00880 [Phycisphaerae bacterium RAS1]
MADAVVAMAQLQCTCGDAPTPLWVTSQMTVKIGNQYAATVMDHAPMANIKPFGTCKTLTASASGVPTPCVPATTSPWSPGSTSVVKIGNFNALLSTDKLACSVGGMISITQAGQSGTVDT